MIVSAMGGGYNGVYIARLYTSGWGLTKSDGTVLTTGIGCAICSGIKECIGVASPITRETVSELIDAIRKARPEITLEIVNE